MRRSGLLLVPIIFLLALTSTGFTVTESLVMADGRYKQASDQIWAAGVISDPGSEGSLSMSYEAAYGQDLNNDDEDYAGNYFVIEQQASVASGETKRHIDISSPYSHGYLMEDMTVTGRTEITERFSMDNELEESKVIPGWWDLF